MILRRSYALGEIKDQIGQNNHFLITSLTGLDLINSTIKSGGKVTSGFSPSWSPKNIQNTVHRSREYILATSLVWVIDMLDTYIKLINQKPRYIESLPLRQKLSGEIKISKKLGFFEEYIDKISKVDLAVVRLGICWRNKATHAKGDVQDLDDEYRDILLNNRDYIKKNYSGWDIDIVLQNYKKIDLNIQKNVSGIIHGVQNLIYSIDGALTSEVLLERYMKAILLERINESEKRARDVFSLPKEKRDQKIKQIFLNNGFTQQSDIDRNKHLASETNPRKEERAQWNVPKLVDVEWFQSFCSSFDNMKLQEIVKNMKNDLATFENLPPQEAERCSLCSQKISSNRI